MPPPQHGSDGAPRNACEIKQELTLAAANCSSSLFVDSSYSSFVTLARFSACSMTTSDASRAAFSALRFRFVYRVIVVGMTGSLAHTHTHRGVDRYSISQMRQKYQPSERNKLSDGSVLCVGLKISATNPGSTALGVPPARRRWWARETRPP